MRKNFAFAIAVFLLLNFNLKADEGHHHEMTPEQLGSVSFETSCAPDVQVTFNAAVAWLYSFEYEHARKQFESVAQADPTCAMAYWGQAMSYYHQLWARPGKEDIQRGHDLLVKAAELKPKTQRENDYIAALSLFYASDDLAQYTSRVKAYSDSMDKLRLAYPKDHEAAVFYALSLLAQSDGRDPEHALERKAVTILNEQLPQCPNHPGITHYIIHATDNPELASMGLAAARAYARVAPASAHAVHMPSHIFARLGLWQEDINSNLAAIAVADKMAGMHTAHHRLHSMDFLISAYLQVGNDAAAMDQINKLKDLPKTDSMIPSYVDYYQQALVLFPATYYIETGKWKEAAEIPIDPAAPPYAQISGYWAHAIAAGHLSDASGAAAAVDQLLKNFTALQNSDESYLTQELEASRDEAISWKLFAAGKTDDAVKLLRSAADKQDKVGKGETDIPAREMLGDMLLKAGRNQEALNEYELSLKANPNRFNGLYGAASAAEALKMEDKAKGYFAQMVKNCEGVQSDRPELAHARGALASLE